MGVFSIHREDLKFHDSYPESWAPTLTVEKGPYLNPSRWCVTVPITEPLNTSDVLQPATEQTEDPPREEIEDTAQDELAPANRPSEDAHTVPHPVEEEVSPLDTTPPPDATVVPEEDARADMTTPDQTRPSAPTVQPDHPDATPDPANILDILEEE